jgi:hypothetical protein
MRTAAAQAAEPDRGFRSFAAVSGGKCEAPPSSGTSPLEVCARPAVSGERAERRRRGGASRTQISVGPRLDWPRAPID